MCVWFLSEWMCTKAATLWSHTLVKQVVWIRHTHVPQSEWTDFWKMFTCKNDLHVFSCHYTSRPWPKLCGCVGACVCMCKTVLPCGSWQSPGGFLHTFQGIPAKLPITHTYIQCKHKPPYEHTSLSLSSYGSVLSTEYMLDLCNPLNHFKI